MLKTQDLKNRLISNCRTWKEKYFGQNPSTLSFNFYYSASEKATNQCCITQLNNYFTAI